MPVRTFYSKNRWLWCATMELYLRRCFIFLFEISRIALDSHWLWYERRLTDRQVTIKSTRYDCIISRYRIYVVCALESLQTSMIILIDNLRTGRGPFYCPFTGYKYPPLPTSGDDMLLPLNWSQKSLYFNWNSFKKRRSSLIPFDGVLFSEKVTLVCIFIVQSTSLIWILMRRNILKEYLCEKGVPWYLRG